MKVKDYDSFNEFQDDFNLSENALDMRSLIRWNGRDIPEKENLSEHTHHVVCLVYDIVDEYTAKGVDFDSKSLLRTIKCALLHDASEIYFGDILASTKNTYPQIKNLIDAQEDIFMKDMVPGLTEQEEALVNLADKSSAQRFLKRLMSSHFCNDFIKSLYIKSKTWVQQARERFEASIGFIPKDAPQELIIQRLTKGYTRDAGVDIILDHDVEFLPHSSTEVHLNWNFTPEPNTTGLILLRTSAGRLGLGINTSPIDPDFKGNVTCIIQNHSDNIIVYKKGEAFCQLVVIPFVTIDAPHRKDGERDDGKYGSTGNVGGVNDISS